jgi:hypothetical protein
MSGSVTKLRQKQITGSIDMSTTAVDAVTIGTGLLSASNLQEDLNNVRALFKDMKGTTAWYGNATYQLTGSAAHGSAIALDASNGSGGIDIDAGAAITIDAGGALSLDAGAASNFSTAAGALTLDGKTGVTIKEDGTAVISVDTSRNVTVASATTFIYLSGTVSDYALSGTIKNSAAKVIESSVATEIETTAGALTLDGKTGINLQENGTTVIAIDNGRNVIIGAAGTQIQLSGTVSDFALSGTIKNSAAKIVESSVATEIETAAGALTLDGKTGVALQANGTQMLSVGPAGVYLSGSVSDFLVTGTIKSDAAVALQAGAGTTIKTLAGSFDVDGAGGVQLQYSGSSYIRLRSGSIVLGDLSGSSLTRGQAPPNIYVSGAIVSSLHLSGSVFVDKLSGSLTTLANGSEYMIAGTNITINTGSSGALTISAVTGTADPGGENTSVQFNDGGDFGGDPGFSFNKTAGLLSITRLTTEFSAHLSGSVSDFNLTGTIKNSTAKVIESSVATEIETTAGALTIDGKTGVALQANGTQMLSVGPAGVYLSGSVSDFSVTGTIKTNAARAIQSSAATEIMAKAGSLGLVGTTAVNLVVDTATQLSVGPAGVYLSGSVSGFELTGTIRSNVAKVIESSVATEIETDAGLLTLDGKTGVNLQVNGTQVLGVGTSGLYVSGNVSSFTVTGAIRSPAATGVRFPEGISGSITRLSSGKSFIEAGSNIVITSGSNTGITIAVTGIDASPTGSKARNFYDVTGTYANGSEIIIHGDGATSQTGFNNTKARHDPYGALDVYLNGQYMQSGTSAANGDYSVGIGCTTTGSIKFFFNLEQGDVIGTFEVNR